jgi:hypothetical protein
VEAPVLMHTWRLLLPDENRYRYGSGDLRPSQAVPYTTGYSDFDDEVEEDTGLVSADSHYGTIYGRATYDGEPVPGVTVTLASISLQGSNTAVTDADGRYRIPYLPPGQYRIEFSLPGLNSYQHDGIQVLAGRNVKVNAPMNVESFAEEIVVRSEASAVSQTGTSYSASQEPRRRRGPSDKELQKRKEQRQQAASARDQLQSLSQGLVGGVRPVPVEIPESGKTLVMEGVLPPAEVFVEIEVKAGRG